jgi:hypothetical protein
MSLVRSVYLGSESRGAALLHGGGLLEDEPVLGLGVDGDVLRAVHVVVVAVADGDVGQFDGDPVVAHVGGVLDGRRDGAPPHDRREGGRWHGRR